MKQHGESQIEVIIAPGIYRRTNKRLIKIKVAENEFRFSIIGEREPLKVLGHNDIKTVLTDFSWSVCMDSRR